MHGTYRKLHSDEEGAVGTEWGTWMSRNAPDTLLSVAQAATLLGVHPNTVRSWTEGGRLAAYRINARGDRRFRRTDVERLLVEDAPAGPTDEPAHRADRDTELALFERVAGGLASSPSPGSVARAMVEALRTELHVERAAVYVATDDGLDLSAHAGFHTPPAATRPLPDPADTRRGDDADRELILATRSGIVGAIVIDAASAERMTSSFERAVASTAATALASARVILRARRELRRARALRSVTKELTGTLDLGSLLGDVVALTGSLFEADKAGLWLLGEGDHPFEIAAQHGLSDAFLTGIRDLRADADTIGTRALRDRRSYWVRNAPGQAVGLMRDLYAGEGIDTACLVPLIGADRPLGLLGLYHRRDHAWPDEEVALLQAFADQAAVAIQNARLYRSVEMQAARIRSIQDLSARLNRLTDVRAIAEAIVAEASTLADYHDIRVYQVDWDRRMCDPIAFTREMLDGTDQTDAEALLRVEIGEGFTGWVAEHGEPMLINDALDDARGKTIDGTADVPESMLVVPMLYEGRALGVIVLSQLGFNRFSTDDLQTMSIFAGYAAQAMANATTYGQLVAQSTELARRAESQRHLLETNERLLGSLDQADVLETIADGLHEVVAYDNLSVYRTDHALRAMLPVLVREQHAEEVSRYVIPFGRGLMGWAVEHAQPILANDALNDPRALQIPGTPAEPEAVVVVPLIADGEVLGAMNASRVGGPDVAFSASDFELIQLFAAQASIALRNADAHHAMSQRAETDALTGLGNHGAFQADLSRLVDPASEAGAAGRRVAVLMMDLDSFKAYNDRHGHPAGDALLHDAATAIYGAARTNDRVYRYGGDEFALILPGTAVAEASRVAERIRAAVAALTASDASPVTITIGVAGLPGDAHDRGSLIEAADTALYYGKRAGEDRVVRADQLPSDVVDLRGTLDELARVALRDGDDPHAVEHLVERATQLSGVLHDEADAVSVAVLTVTRALGASHSGTGPDRKLDVGHGDRVGRLTVRIAERLGLRANEVRALELAGRLHNLDDRAVAELSAVPSLHRVAAMIAGQRSLIAEGARRARRGPRARGPIGPHVLGVAGAYDALVSGVAGRRMGRADAMAAVRSDPATFRSDVLNALAAVVDERGDQGRRRRATDQPAEERGAA